MAGRAALVVLVAVAIVVGACTAEDGGGSGSLTCGEYLSLGDDSRGRVVRTLGVELGWSEVGSPFAVVTVDSVCGQQSNPDVLVRDVVELIATPRTLQTFPSG